MECRFRPRCTKEVIGAEEVRLDKICRIIRECSLGIHDLSRVELDKTSKLPRFNMPFELGLFYGAIKFGPPALRRKSFLIMDKGKYRYKQFLSDIGGNDIVSHNGNIPGIIAVTRDWLNSKTRKDIQPDSKDILRRYEACFKALKKFCGKKSDKNDNMKREIDYSTIIKFTKTWLEENAQVKGI